MSSKRSIDIAKVSRTQAGVQNPTQTQTVKPLRHHRTQKLGYWSLVARGWRLVFDSKVFQVSLLRNLFGLRGLFFSLIPLAFFQLRFYFVLKPSQILSKANKLVASDNTALFLSLFVFVLILVIISFLADTIIIPAIMRYNFQKIGNRKPKMYRCIKDSASLSLPYVAAKSLKFIIFLLFLGLYVMAFMVGYSLASGSMTTIVLFSAVAVTLALLLISLYFAFKNWLLGSVSVGYRQKKAKIWLALHRIFGNFISSAAQGFGWILTLAVFIALSCLISYFEIKYIDGTDVLIAQLSCLAIATTALYLSWSIWTAWQTGYWSGIIENNALDEGLQYARVDESSSWQFFGLTVLCTFVVLSCFVGSLMYSDKLINLLTTISKNIPDKLQINLPKPQ